MSFLADMSTQLCLDSDLLYSKLPAKHEHGRHSRHHVLKILLLAGMAGFQQSSPNGFV